MTSRVRNEKQNNHSQAPWINQTLILIKQEILFGNSVMCNCKGSAGPRKQKAKNENKLNSMKIGPPTQERKQATFSPKQCSWNGKAMLEIRSVLCLKKLLLRSVAPVVAWHLLYLESFNWRAEVTMLPAAHTWLIERHSSVLANSASPALCFLAALASLAAEFQIPVERVARIPQKPRYCLDKTPVPLRF